MKQSTKKERKDWKKVTKGAKNAYKFNERIKRTAPNRQDKRLYSEEVVRRKANHATVSEKR